MMADMEHRRDILKAVGLSIGGVFPLLGTAAAHLPDKVVTADSAKLTRETFGENRVFFDGPTDQLRSMTAGSLLLNAGMEPHPPHQHPEEEIMVVTEGTGDILVGGKHVQVGPGAMMYCESNRLHGIRNTGQQPLLFYYYKWLK